MSLIKPMVLVIIFSLSDGGEVIYELNNSIYTQRVIFSEAEGGIKEMITIYRFGDSTIFHLDVSHESEKVEENQILPAITNWSYEEKYKDKLEPFYLNNRRGYQMVYSDISGVSGIHYHIQINELRELFNDGKLHHVIPVLDDLFLYVYSDVVSSSQDEFVRPVSVNIERSNSFSDIISNRLTQLKMK